MKNLRLLGIALTLAFGVPLRTAAQSPEPEYGIRESRGSLFLPKRLELVKGSSIPINKTYSELTPQERANVNSWYEKVEPGDEPPFPAEGLKPVYAAMAKAQAKLLVTGDLWLIAAVGADGEVTSVKAIGSPSPEMTRFAAAVVTLTRFKPALCKGVPCKMEFPFCFAFQVD